MGVKRCTGSPRGELMHIVYKVPQSSLYLHVIVKMVMTTEINASPSVS